MTFSKGFKILPIAPLQFVMRPIPADRFRHSRLSRFTTIVGLTAAAVALVSFIRADAGEAKASFGVGATVVPVARLELHAVPQVLTVSEADVAAGFVDVVSPTQVDVHSNSRAGYLLSIQPRSTVFASVEVRGLGDGVILGAEGGNIAQRWQQPQRQSLSLTYRFHLAPGVAPGTYPWPVQLAVLPL